MAERDEQKVCEKHTLMGRAPCMSAPLPADVAMFITLRLISWSGQWEDDYELCGGRQRTVKKNQSLRVGPKEM